MPSYEHYRYQRELTEKRRVQDALVTERHRQWNLAAQDRTPKSDRPHFAVVGEGSQSAQDAYREGWERTFGRRTTSSA